MGGYWDQAAPLSSPCPLSSSKAAVRAVQAMNRICVLDVDLQGVRNIKKTDLRPIYIFVQPPSLDVLVGVGRGWGGQGWSGLAEALGGPGGWSRRCPATSEALTTPSPHPPRVSGAAAAAAQHGNRGELGQASGCCSGRHGEQ